MERKNKIIITITIILIVILAGYLIINYTNQLNNQEFKEVLKNASDIENTTDQHYKEAYNGTYMSIDEYITFTKSNIENHTKEIDLLKNFKDKTTNQTQKEYLEIQINRLETELRAYEKAVEIGNSYKRYQNGEITLNKYSELQNTLTNDTQRIDNQIGIIKDESITYINNHPELKETLNNINIDEDFYTNELGGTSGNGRIYFTK